MIEADAAHFKEHGVPLFRCVVYTIRNSFSNHPSSHMLDLSEEPKAENIALCKRYLEKLAPLNIWLEMEIGMFPDVICIESG